jgi:hypothetical protein
MAAWCASAQQSAADYRLWAADPWSSFARKPDAGCARISARDARTVSFGLGREGYDAAAIIIANLSPSDALQARVVMSDFVRRQGAKRVPASRCLKVHEAVFVPTRSGGEVPDALRPLEFGGMLTVAAREEGQLFLVFNSHGLDAGDYEARLTLQPQRGGPAKSVRLVAQVWDFALPARMPISVFTWDYGNWTRTRQPQLYLEELVEHGVNVFHCADIPPVQCDRDGNLAAEPDFTTMDKIVTALKGKGQLMIEATGMFQIKKDFTTPDGATVPYLSPPWKKAFAAWLVRLASYLQSRGVDYDDWLFYPYDEWVGPEFRELAQETKRINPQVRIFSDKIATVAELRAIAPYVDVWCPELNMMQERQNRPGFEFMKASGKPVWFYFCGWDQRVFPPYELYRLMGWRAWRWGLQGATFWTVYCWLGDEWRNTESQYGDPSTVYRGMNGPVPSRRWEAFRAGLQDYCYLWLLDGEVRRAEATGADAAISAARKVLSHAGQDVSARQEQHSRADYWRREIARTILRLRQAVP